MLRSFDSSAFASSPGKTCAFTHGPNSPCLRLALSDRARANHWSRLYWHTRSDNPARRLYDEFVKADDFVRHRMVFD